MRLVQLRDEGGRRAVAVTSATGHRRLDEIETVYELVLAALEAGIPLAETAARFQSKTTIDVAAAAREGRLLPPLEHPVPTRCWVTASAPADGEGPPSWFFRGSGSTLVGAEQPLPLPGFAPAGAPVAQLLGLYVIADDGTPCQAGWALGHPVVDPALAMGSGAGHARLRCTAVGPELLIGALPAELPAIARARRKTAVVGERRFDLGTASRTHSYADLARDHFRYQMHRRPGDVHVHCFGTSAPDTALATGDDLTFELECAAFGLPLRNRVTISETVAPTVRML
jgi:hypothetical protein